MEDGVKVSYLKGKKRNHSLIFLCIAIGAALIVGGTLLIIYLDSNDTKKQDLDTAVIAANPADPANFVISGDYEGGQKKLDDNLAASTDDSSRSAIYINKSSIAINMGEYDDAYEFAEKAEELLPTVSSAKLMASALAKQGLKEEAIEKYQIAISRITGDSDNSQTEKSSIQLKIDSL